MERTRLRFAAVAVHDVLAVLCVATVLSCGFAASAFAYVDPSVLTYTIQAVAGVAVALSAVMGVAFRRTRRVLMKRLGIDENARKEKEPSIRREGGEPAFVPAISRGAEDVTDQMAHMQSAADDVASLSAGVGGAGATASGNAGQSTDGGAKRGTHWRAAAFAAVFFAFTLFVVAPLEMVAGSAGSLVFGVVQVWPIVVVGALTLAVLLAVVLAVLPERAFRIGYLAVLCLGVCCWLQAMFMNEGLPTADGGTIDWTSFMPITVISAIVWLAVLVVPQIVQRFKGRLTHTVATVVACALLVVQGVGVVSLFLPSAASEELHAENHGYVTTEQGMFTVSNANNVIVFVLDNYDTVHLQQAVAEEPGLLDEFSGFTWYENSTAAMIPTRYGIPFLLTGQYPRYDEKFSTFLAERYDRSTYLSDISATGANVGIYSDTLGLQYVSDSQAVDAVYSKAMNFHRIEDVPIDVWGSVRMLAVCALYRDMPWVAKPAFWFYTDQVNNEMTVRNGDSGLDEMPYTMSDGRWYEQLQSHGLALDPDAAAPAFRFIHLLGTHTPYIVDENGRDVGLNGSTLVQQARGSIRMVSEYLHQLKQLGVYDRTTIIVTADHGDWYLTPNPLEVPSSPIMLVKPADAALRPIEISPVAASAIDVMPTVLDALGADVSAYGAPISALDDVDRPRRYLMTTSDGAHDQEILEYEIVGDALDMANWRLTGQSWAAQE